MGLETGAIIGIVGAVATVAGSGVAFYASRQQAATQRSIANQNFALQQEALESQRKQSIRALELQTSQLELQKLQRDIESSAVDTQKSALDFQKTISKETFAAKQKQIDLQRSILKENKANALQAASRIAMEAAERNKRRAKERETLLSRQRAAYAAAGILFDEGTPLAVLGETAALYAMQSADEVYVARLEHRGETQRAKAIGLDIEGLDLESQLLKLEKQTSLSEIDLNRSMLDIEQAGIGINKRQLDISKSLLTLDSYSVQSQFRQQNRQNEIDRVSAFSGASGTEMAGYGQLFSNIGGIASTYGSSLFTAPTQADWRASAS